MTAADQSLNCSEDPTTVKILSWSWNTNPPRDLHSIE